MLAILTTHPIQYQVPIWKALASRGRVPFKVFFMNDQGSRNSFDAGFQRNVSWDIDLLSGYEHEFLKVKVGSHQDSFGWLRLTRASGAAIAKSNPSILWLQGWQVAAYWQATAWARYRGLKLWLRGESNSRSAKASSTPSLRRTAVNLLLRQMDKLLFIGKANRRFYLERGILESRLAFAPYCVDNARFDAAAERSRTRREQIRQTWGIPVNAFCILYVGKFMDKKRPLDLVYAARQLMSDSTKPIHLLWAGTGELDTTLRAHCVTTFDAGSRQLPLTPPAHASAHPPASFVGFLNQTEIPDAYAAADCLVLPSDGRETWGLVVNEALACGLPCIVSDACGCAEDLVLPSRTDLRFQVGDIQGLAGAIRSLIHSPVDTADLRNHIAKYDYLHTVEAVEALYLQC